jgi:hypothetical protein
MYFSLRVKLNDSHQLEFLNLSTETNAGPRYWTDKIKYSEDEWSIETQSAHHFNIKTNFYIPSNITLSEDTITFNITFPNLTDGQDPFYAFNITIEYNIKNKVSIITKFSSTHSGLYLV